jgi:hypothetical protein
MTPGPISIFAANQLPVIDHVTWVPKELPLRVHVQELLNEAFLHRTAAACYLRMVPAIKEKSWVYNNLM